MRYNGEIEGYISVARLAKLMDDATDDEAQWNGGDVCEMLSDLIHRAGGFKQCKKHGHYAKEKRLCPCC